MIFKGIAICVLAIISVQVTTRSHSNTNTNTNTNSNSNNHGRQNKNRRIPQITQIGFRVQDQDEIQIVYDGKSGDQRPKVSMDNYFDDEQELKYFKSVMKKSMENTRYKTDPIQAILNAVNETISAKLELKMMENSEKFSKIKPQTRSLQQQQQSNIQQLAILNRQHQAEQDLYLQSDQENSKSEQQGTLFVQYIDQQHAIYDFHPTQPRDNQKPEQKQNNSPILKQKNKKK